MEQPPGRLRSPSRRRSSSASTPSTPTSRSSSSPAGANYDEIAQRFQAASSTDNLPDLVIASDVWWFRYFINGQIMPLDKVFAHLGVDTGDFVPTLYGDYEFEGQHWAAPYARSTPLFYYNKDLWAKAGLPDRGPKDWAELESWARAAARRASRRRRAAGAGHRHLVGGVVVLEHPVGPRRRLQRRVGRHPGHARGARGGQLRARHVPRPEGVRRGGHGHQRRLRRRAPSPRSSAPPARSAACSRPPTSSWARPSCPTARRVPAATPPPAAPASPSRPRAPRAAARRRDVPRVHHQRGEHLGVLARAPGTCRCGRRRSTGPSWVRCTRRRRSSAPRSTS